ncbi:MAG: type IV toxin-antitoxin system AbiEi family antitoxin domain-containing protein [Actinomycetota bacterium]
MRASYDPKRTEKSVDGAVARVAANQHGLLTRAQALKTGATPGMIRWRLQAGRWQRVLPSTYLVAGAPPSWRRQAMAACLHLGPGATLSFRAAATLCGMTDIKTRRLEVTVTKHRNRSGNPRIVIHIPEDPSPPEDLTTIDGIPVTKPARTLLDLATIESADVLEQCLDDALRRRLVSIAFLERWLADPQRKRHRGARRLQRLVDERAARGVTESPVETSVLQLIRSRRLPLPMLQYVVTDAGRFIARLDFAYPDQRVAIEVDGFRHHDTRATFDDERARGNAIEALGWRILRVTAAHLERDPDAVIAWIARALEG